MTTQACGVMLASRKPVPYSVLVQHLVLMRDTFGKTRGCVQLNALWVLVGLGQPLTRLSFCCTPLYL